MGKFIQISLLLCASLVVSCDAGWTLGKDCRQVEEYLEKSQTALSDRGKIMTALTDWLDLESKLATTKARTSLIGCLEQLLELPKVLEDEARCSKASVEILKKNDARFSGHIYTDKRFTGSVVENLVLDFAMEHYEQCKEDYESMLEAKFTSIGAELLSPVQTFLDQLIEPCTTNKDMFQLELRPRDKHTVEAAYIAIRKNAKEQTDATILHPENCNRRGKKVLPEVGALVSKYLVVPCADYVHKLESVLAPAETDLIQLSKLYNEVSDKLYKHLAYFRLCRSFIQENDHRPLASAIIKYCSKRENSSSRS